MFLSELTFPVSDIEGIGSAASRDLSNLGIYNVAQLLRHYPVRYEDRITRVPLSHSSPENPALTVATVVNQGTFPWKGGMALKIIIEDQSASASMLCFGRNFLGKKLSVGKKIWICGPFTRNQYGEIQSGTFVFENYNEDVAPVNFGLILPVYPLAGKLSQSLLRKSIQFAIDKYALRLYDELPISILAQRNISHKTLGIKEIHFPSSIKNAMMIRQELIFEELYHLQIAVIKRQVSTRSMSPNARQWNTTISQKLESKLPFQFTPDQKQVLRDIQEDMSTPGTMLRLIQGEVGSGKTLVAFMACLFVIGAKRQAAFMAPTELLARQHADNAGKVLSPLGVKVAFLTGEVSGSSRNSLAKALAAGEIDLVIGTHALFSSDIVFHDLALAIIDEQHRFGVEQRRALTEKGLAPDILALSATPIPRTLALTAFGDMDVSSIKTMPKGRKPIETHLTRLGNERKVYDFVRKELQAGHRAYFVYPLIEESEKTNMKDAESMHHILGKDIFPDFKGALIHSRKSEEEKRQIMGDFREGLLNYLVATSVVEVGVDVPEATCMIVEHAERFGLSALHQLRGRVGRGNNASWCFLIYNEPLTDEGKQRLLTMKNVTDGFKLAEEDLKIRGPGDMAGVKQSGFLRFTIANPVRDIDLLLEARKEAQVTLSKDPHLLENDNRKLGELFRLHPPFDENLLCTM